ncbi:MAG TPA: flagellar hook-basal body complex protein FliE [Bryobacteraceae bacterium]|jgi:flagellar hook-basal body complex protein FliE|nr:flagellar hook-basal body complex protein FliE [Bryobacteraceae bacterium]
MSLTLKMPSLATIAPIAPQPVAPEAAQGSTTPFGDVLSSAIQEVEGTRASSDQSIQQFLSGEGGDLHATILSSERADLEFQMFLQVRNKVVSAYQEIMKMQV